MGPVRVHVSSQIIYTKRVWRSFMDLIYIWEHVWFLPRNIASLGNRWTYASTVTPQHRSDLVTTKYPHLLIQHQVLIHREIAGWFVLSELVASPGVHRAVVILDKFLTILLAAPQDDQLFTAISEPFVVLLRASAHFIPLRIAPAFVRSKCLPKDSQGRLQWPWLNFIDLLSSLSRWKLKLRWLHRSTDCLVKSKKMAVHHSTCERLWRIQMAHDILRT